MALRAALLGSLAVALLALVAFGSQGGGVRGGGERSGGLPSALTDSLYTFGIVAALIVAASYFLLRLAVAGLASRVGGGYSTLTMIAIIALVTIFGVASYDAFKELAQRIREGDAGDVIGIGRPPAEADDGVRAADRDPEFQWWLAIVMVAGVTVAYVWLFWNRAQRRTVAPARDLGEELELVLTDTLADLEAEHDPRRAVIRAYARMEAVLAAHGLPRAPHEAPLEYLARVLRELRVRAEAAHALTELFERAKFSQHEIDVAMKEEAISALVRVRDDLKAAA
jgi:hypothetical protein